MEKNYSLYDKLSTDSLFFLDLSYKMALEILKEKPVSNVKKDWSYNVNINTSINTVYKFLLSIDNNLANFYLNMINYVDKDNEPVVHFLAKSSYPNIDSFSDCVDSYGNAYIYYGNNPEDMFIILHEMIHLLNRSVILDDGDKQTNTGIYFSELPSIMSELILGKYLVNNNYITKNDLDIINNKRLISIKDNARTVVIINLILILEKNNMEITKKNLLSLLTNNIEDIEIKNYIEDMDIKYLVEDDFLEYVYYVLAYYIAKKYMDKHNTINRFLYLNGEVGNYKSDINRVLRKLERDRVI